MTGFKNLLQVAKNQPIRFTSEFMTKGKRQVRRYIRAWRLGDDPRLEGRMMLALQAVEHGIVQALHPIFRDWVHPCEVEPLTQKYLGTGWTLATPAVNPLAEPLKTGAASKQKCAVEEKTA